MIAVAGTAVRLAASSGVVTEMSLAQLLMSEGFRDGRCLVTSAAAALDAAGGPAGGGGRGGVVVGAAHRGGGARGSAEAPAGTSPKPEYDPAAVSLTRREQAKAAELTVAGRPVTASAIAKRRRRYGVVA